MNTTIKYFIIVISIVVAIPLIVPVAIGILTLAIASINGVSVNLAITKKPNADQISSFSQGLKVGSFIYSVRKRNVTDSGGMVEAESNIFLVLSIDGDLVYITPLQKIECDPKYINCNLSKEFDSVSLRNFEESKLPQFITLSELKSKGMDEFKIYKADVQKYNFGTSLVYEDRLDDRPVSKNSIVRDGSLCIYIEQYAQDDMNAATGDITQLTNKGVSMVLTSKYSFSGYIEKIIDRGHVVKFTQNEM